MVSDLHVSSLQMCGTLNQAFLFLCPEWEELLEVSLTDLLQTHQGKAKRETILKPPVRCYDCKEEIGKEPRAQPKGALAWHNAGRRASSFPTITFRIKTCPLLFLKVTCNNT